MVLLLHALQEGQATDDTFVPHSILSPRLVWVRNSFKFFFLVYIHNYHLINLFMVGVRTLCARHAWEYFQYIFGSQV